MKRFLSLILAVMLVALALTGCGGTTSEIVSVQSTSIEQSNGSTPAASTAGDLAGDITFWHSFTQGARMEAVQAAADNFMKMYPDVNITIETYAWGDFNTKWNAGITTGDLPDMSTAQNTGEVIEMVNAGALRSADSLIDHLGRERFSANALNDMNWEGATYGVPYYSHAQVMWFRKDLLQEKNIEVPKTWAQFHDAAVALTADGTYGAGFSCSPNDLLCTRYLNYYVQSGGSSLLTDDLQANLTSDLALEGINFWLDVYRNCSPAETINYTVNDHATLFYQGITAFDFNSGFMISGVENNSPDLAQYVDCEMLPKINESDADYSAEATHIPLVMWDKAKSPEVCEAFIEYLYEKDNYITFLEAVPVGMLPSIDGIAKDPAYLANPTVEEFSHSVEVITEAIDLGSAIGFEHGPSVQASFLTSQGVIENMFQDILTNGTDVETAAKAAEDKLNEIFATMIA